MKFTAWSKKWKEKMIKMSPMPFFSMRKQSGKHGNKKE
jgi:hypothetical protein